MAARVCDLDDCSAPHLAKGLCGKHYRQTPERRAAGTAAMARYLATDKGKAAAAACYALWRATDAGKAAHAAGGARYRATPKGKATVAAARILYAATDEGRAEAERKWAKAALGRATGHGAVIGDVPADTRAILRARFGETCLVDGCDNPATDIDHVVALANGGIHDISNFQILCGPCNKAKSTETIDYRRTV